MLRRELHDLTRIWPAQQAGQAAAAGSSEVDNAERYNRKSANKKAITVVSKGCCDRFQLVEFVGCGKGL